MLLIIQTELLALGWLGMDIKDDNYDDITEPKKKTSFSTDYSYGSWWELEINLNILVYLESNIHWLIFPHNPWSWNLWLKKILFKNS